MSIEERAYKHYPIKRIGLPEEIAASDEGWEGYVKGATEQKAIDEAQIKELESIIELTASVIGIGTKWFSDVARMDAVRELREKILKYYE